MDRKWSWRDLTFLLIATAACLAFAWVGYLDSDDKNHLVGAFGWFHDPPYVARAHGELRHFIAIPIAICFKLFGVNEATIVLPNLAYFAAIVVLTYIYVTRFYERAVALLAVAFLVTLPIFAIRATVAYSDITELVFVAASIWLFYDGLGGEGRTAKLFLAGVAAGAAWLTRETTVSLLLLYFLLFLIGYRIERRFYWIMAGGFLAIVAVDALYMAWHTGNPLYRYWMVLDAQGGIQPRGADSGDGFFDPNGNIRVLAGLDPLFVLLLNHEFALFYFFALPALWWAWRGKGLSRDEHQLARILLGLSVIWFLFVAVMLKNQHPRYYSVTTYGAAILCALWFRRYVLPRARLFAVAGCAAVIGASLLGIYVDNKDALFGERALVEYVSTHGATLYTDPTSHRRARFLLELEGAADLVVSDRPPPDGALYYHNPNRVRESGNNGLQGTLVKPGWEPVWHGSSGRKLSGRLIEVLGLRDLVPGAIYRKLNKPNQDVSVYRVAG